MSKSEKIKSHLMRFLLSVQIISAVVVAKRVGVPADQRMDPQENNH